MIGSTQPFDPFRNLYPAHPPVRKPLPPHPTQIESDGELGSSSDTSDASPTHTSTQSSCSLSSQELSDSPVNRHRAKGAPAHVEKASGQPAGIWRKGVKREEKTDGSPVSESKVRLIKVTRQRPSRVSDLCNSALAEKGSELGSVVSKQTVYKLDDVPAEEWMKIRKQLESRPEFTKNYDFRIQKVTNDVLNRQFEGKKEGLNLAADNKALTGSFADRQEQDIRRSVVDSIEKMQSPTEYPNVYTLTAFHAPKKEFKDSVLKSGLHFLGKTDQGYFGQGIYFTTYPEYSVLYGGRGGGIILICEVAYRSLFPVATCDDLMGKPILPGFDGHAIHVVPQTENPNEMMYVSRGPWQKAKYDEIVVRDPSQTVIRYVMEYNPKASFLKQISEKRTRKELQVLIERYLDQNPNSDLFHALESKLSDNSSLEKTLDSNEVNLFNHLQRSLGERDVKTQKNLEERIQKLLTKDDFIELPSSYIEEQEALDSKDDADGNLTKGDEYFRKNKYRQAIAAYQKFLKHSPQSFRANVGCGSAYFRLGDWNQAIPHFKEALKIKPKDTIACKDCVSALINRAKESIKQRADYFAGATDLMEALEYDSKNLEALGLLASIYYSQDCPKKAYRAANRALAFNARYAIALRVRGAIYAGWGKRYYNKAREDLCESLKNPTEVFLYTFALRHRARLYIAMDLLKEAQEDCSVLLGKDADDIESLMLRAKIAIMQNQPKLAEKDLKKCEKLSPNDNAIDALFGELWLQKGDLIQALKYFNQSFTNYQRLKDKEEEEAKILKNKDHLEFYDILLQRAKVHHKLKSLTLALEDYKRAITMFPDKPEAYKQLGEAYRAWGDEDNALANEKTARVLEANELERHPL